jgi:hypothetical protein
MDFWLGHWEVTFTSDGKETAGTNTISKHAGRIFELFTAPDGEDVYVGASITRHDRQRGIWVQEYWDNQGYRAWYEGGWQGDRFILDIAGRGGHEAGTKRLVWRDITDDALMWDNEQTKDGGKTWSSTWTIAYKKLRPASR